MRSEKPRLCYKEVEFNVRDGTPCFFLIKIIKPVEQLCGRNAEIINV